MHRWFPKIRFWKRLFNMTEEIFNSKLQYHRIILIFKNTRLMESINAILLKTKQFKILCICIILIDKSKTSLGTKLAHSCWRKVGERVVRYRSYLTIIIWYFRFAWFQVSINIPAEFLINDLKNGSISKEEVDEM